MTQSLVPGAIAKRWIKLILRNKYFSYHFFDNVNKNFNIPGMGLWTIVLILAVTPDTTSWSRDGLWKKTPNIKMVKHSWAGPWLSGLHMCIQQVFFPSSFCLLPSKGVTTANKLTRRFVNCFYPGCLSWNNHRSANMWCGWVGAWGSSWGV